MGCHVGRWQGTETRGAIELTMNIMGIKGTKEPRLDVDGDWEISEDLS